MPACRRRGYRRRLPGFFAWSQRAVLHLGQIRTSFIRGIQSCPHRWHVNDALADAARRTASKRVIHAPIIVTSNPGQTGAGKEPLVGTLSTTYAGI